MSEPVADRSLALLTFEMAALQREVDQVRATIKELRVETVALGVWDIAQGSNRVDIGRLDNELHALEVSLEAARKSAEAQHERLAERIATTEKTLGDRLGVAEKSLTEKIVAEGKAAADRDKATNETINNRFRALVIAFVTAFVAPLTVGGILLLVSVLGGR